MPTATTAPACKEIPHSPASHIQPQIDERRFWLSFGRAAGRGAPTVVARGDVVISYTYTRLGSPRRPVARTPTPPPCSIACLQTVMAEEFELPVPQMLPAPQQRLSPPTPPPQSEHSLLSPYLPPPPRNLAASSSRRRLRAAGQAATQGPQTTPNACPEQIIGSSLLLRGKPWSEVEAHCGVCARAQLRAQMASSHEYEPSG